MFSSSLLQSLLQLLPGTIRSRKPIEVNSVCTSLSTSHDDRVLELHHRCVGRHHRHCRADDPAGVDVRQVEQFNRVRGLSSCHNNRLRLIFINNFDDRPPKPLDRFINTKCYFYLGSAKAQSKSLIHSVYVCDPCYIMRPEVYSLQI